VLFYDCGGSLLNQCFGTRVSVRHKRCRPPALFFAIKRANFRCRPWLICRGHRHPCYLLRRFLRYLSHLFHLFLLAPATSAPSAACCCPLTAIPSVSLAAEADLLARPPRQGESGADDADRWRVMRAGDSGCWGSGDRRAARCVRCGRRCCCSCGGPFRNGLSSPSRYSSCCLTGNVASSA
jgi:hypothetical protein